VRRSINRLRGPEEESITLAAGSESFKLQEQVLCCACVCL